jgi:hypothetical protein
MPADGIRTQTPALLEFPPAARFTAYLEPGGFMLGGSKSTAAETAPGTARTVIESPEHPSPLDSGATVNTSQ